MAQSPLNGRDFRGGGGLEEAFSIQRAILLQGTINISVLTLAVIKFGFRRPRLVIFAGAFFQLNRTIDAIAV